MSDTRSASHPTLPAHMPALDGLRGIAILLVLFHMFSLLEPQAGVASYVYAKVSYVGWVGVQLFFVLSGFLITGILLDSQAAENYYGAFFARRTLRIFPLYFAVLAIAFVLLPALGAVPASIARDQPNQIWLWTYMENWAGVQGFGSKTFPHFWSLAVEEQFYLVWPFLIRRQRATTCLGFCLSLAVLSLGLRCWMVWNGASHESIYPNSFCRMDALALGGAAAAAFRIPALRALLIEKRVRVLVYAFITFLLGIVVTRGFWHMTGVGQTIGYSIIAAMFMLLLMAAVATDCISGTNRRISGAWSLTGVLRLGPLAIAGKYSYGMYVFHKPIHDFIGKPLLARLQIDPSQSMMADVGYVACGTLLTLLVSIVSYHLFEKHFLRLRHRFAPRNAA
jgi:peptidoglycan/LPS O-acetylase OafA/YrhL